MRVEGTFPKRGLALRPPRENNARPTQRSPQKTAPRQSTPKIWPRLKEDVSVILKARPYSQKHLLPSAYWPWEVTVLDAAM